MYYQENPAYFQVSEKAITNTRPLWRQLKQYMHAHHHCWGQLDEAWIQAMSWWLVMQGQVPRMSSASWLQREGRYTSSVCVKTVMEWKYIKMTFILLLLKSFLNLI